jgi:hypothetical protein
MGAGDGSRSDAAASKAAIHRNQADHRNVALSVLDAA